jgi:hypothetical protein
MNEVGEAYMRQRITEDTPGIHNNLLYVFLCRWSGSLLKLVWGKLAVWLTLYYAVHFYYHYAMDREQQK